MKIVHETYVELNYDTLRASISVLNTARLTFAYFVLSGILSVSYGKGVVGKF